MGEAGTGARLTQVIREHDIGFTLARIPQTYAITKLGYTTNVFDLEPVLIQPAYIQCAEPSDREIVAGLKKL